jgi:hypothetical protein
MRAARWAWVAMLSGALSPAGCGGGGSASPAGGGGTSGGGGGATGTGGGGGSVATCIASEPPSPLFWITAGTISGQVDGELKTYSAIVTQGALAGPPEQVVLGSFDGEAGFNVVFAPPAVGTYHCPDDALIAWRSGVDVTMGWGAGNGAKPGASCTIVVSAFGAIGTAMRGTFSAVLTPVADISGTRTVTSGAFDIIRCH